MLAFLAQAEQSQQEFDLEDLAEETGYKMSSIRTYYGKRLKNVLVHEQPNGRYTAQGLEVFEDQSFIDYMTQRSAPPDQLETVVIVEPEVAPVVPHDHRQTLSETMLRRAQDTCLSALMMFHDRHHHDSLALFGMSMLRAWSMLLKSEIAQHRGIEPMYPAEHPLRSKSLSELLATIYPEDQDPVRKNLEWVSLFVEDNAELLFQDVAPYLSRLFQATVLNFRKRFEAMAGRRLIAHGIGQLIIISDDTPPDFDALRELYGDFAASRLHHLLQELRFEEAQVQHTHFCVEAGWTLSMYHNTMRQTIPLVEGEGPLDALQKLDADQGSPPHPFSTVEAIQQINTLLPYEHRIAARAIEVIDMVYRVRQNPPNRYVDLRDGHWCYSRAYVHWIARCIRRDDQWLIKTKQALSSRGWQS